MPFYASAEQIMRDRSEYARKGIARARSAVVRRRPARREPRRFVDSPNFRSYPGGWDVTRVGTFPAGCPVRER